MPLKSHNGSCQKRGNMQEITIEELEGKVDSGLLILDIRPEEDYRRGSLPGAVNLPMDRFSDKKDELPADRPLYLLCHTGENSRELAEILE